MMLSPSSSLQESSLLGLLRNKTVEKRHLDSIQLLNIHDLTINLVEKLLFGVPLWLPSQLVHIGGNKLAALACQ